MVLMPKKKKPKGTPKPTAKAPAGKAPAGKTSEQAAMEEGRKQLSAKMEKVRKQKLESAERFKDDVLKKYGKIVKAVVVFGSLVRGDFTDKSDIDMLVVIDDVMARLSAEQKDRLDDGLHDMAKHVADELSVQPAWTLSEFWDMARIGHPLLYTIVRDGWALYDTGFFVPVRKLLELGKIPATLEAVEKFMESAPQKIKRVESAKLYMVAEDLYYAMLNSSQAVLMFLGENPTTPKETVRAVKEHLIEPKLLEEEYMKALEKVIEFRKGVEHREVKDLAGPQLDEFISDARRYVERMEQLLSRLQEKRKAGMIEKNYEVLIKACVATLKKLDRLPPDPKDLPQAFKLELVDRGRVEPYFLDIFKRVISMRKALDDEKHREIPQREIELMREYVRRFVRDVAPLIEEEPEAGPAPAKKKGK